MIVEVMLRRRAELDESASALNDRLLPDFVSIPGFWAHDKDLSDAKFDGSTGVGATLDLRKCLEDGLRGQISYIGRLPGYIADTAKSDDFLALRLNTEKANYSQFATKTFPRLIEVFRPYRAVIETDSGLAMAGWEVVKKQRKDTGRDIDGRDSVFRIWTVNFFDDLLCRRSFGIAADEVVRRASAECERAELLDGGAFLLVTSDLIVGSALDDLSARVMSRLGRQ